VFLEGLLELVPVCLVVLDEVIVLEEAVVRRELEDQA